MSSGTIDYFEGIDGSRAAEALVTSILINGRGQYVDPRSSESSTAPFERLSLDRSTNIYRIRLINGGSTFGLKFSIDDQLLEVIASDGIPLEKPVLVDEVLLGLGERYDLLINITGSTSRLFHFSSDQKLNENYFQVGFVSIRLIRITILVGTLVRFFTIPMIKLLNLNRRRGIVRENLPVDY